MLGRAETMNRGAMAVWNQICINPLDRILPVKFKREVIFYGNNG
jgi:hypothetical protein